MARRRDRERTWLFDEDSYWVSESLPGGEWWAIYRLRPQDGYFVVAEARVVPRPHDDTQQAELDAALLAAPDLPIPQGGLRSEPLKYVSTSNAEKHGREFFESQRRDV